MSLNVNKVLSVVSNVSGKLATANVATNGSIVPAITSGIKNSGLNLSSVKNIVSSISGGKFDISNLISFDKIGNALNLDLDMSKLMPSGFSLDSLTSGLDINSMFGNATSMTDMSSITDGLSSLEIPSMDSISSAMPDINGITNSIGVDGSVNGATSQFDSIMDDVNSSLGSLNLGNMDWTSSFAHGISIF